MDNQTKPKARIVEIGIVDAFDQPKGWVFDATGLDVDGIHIDPPVPSEIGASVEGPRDALRVDATHIPLHALYGGYTVNELREIAAASQNT